MIHRLVMVALIACGAPAPAPREPFGADPEPGATPCSTMIAHLDAEGFTDGGSVTIGDDTVTRDSLALRCSRYSPWVIRCLSVTLTTADLSRCGPGNEPTNGTYAGPTADEKAAFEECVAAATTMGQLDGCSY